METQQTDRFSWSLGGLLGVAVGCSAWIALTPFVAGWNLVGIVVAIVCVTAILLTVPILWSVRAKIEALQGMFIFLALAFAITFCFLFYAHFMELPLAVSWPLSKLTEASECFWILLLYPALALLFWFIGSSRKSNSSEAN